MSRKRCFVCKKLSYVDKHHIIPVEYGGKEEGKTVNLCPTCHREVHRDAESRFKEFFPYEFSIDKIDPLDRLHFLSQHIFKAKRSFKESKMIKAETARNIIAISLSNDELAITHDLKRSLGFKSVSSLIKHLIGEAWVKKRRLTL